jgi:hypothetical protein
MSIFVNYEKGRNNNQWFIITTCGTDRQKKDDPKICTL